MFKKSETGNRRLDQAVAAWRASGPLEDRSMELLLDLREANTREQPEELIWAAFVRSLSPEQQKALDSLVELVGKEGVLSGSR